MGVIDWWSKIFYFLFTSKLILLFFFEKGGISLCLWGFLCPLCLQLQTWSYSHDLSTISFENELTESQFERYPPWSCRGVVDRSESVVLLFLSCCCCLYGVLFGGHRHWDYPDHVNLEYYCSSQHCCCRCCHKFAIEDCLIGHFCCCCSVIQVTMANDERFRMQSKVEGDVNIKRAHWKERKKYWRKRWGFGNGKIEPAQILNRQIKSSFGYYFFFNYYSFEII